MDGKTLKAKLVRGEAVFGTFFQHAVAPAIVDFLPDGALDFVIVSAEHNGLDLAEFLPIRYALASKGIACLARIHSREPDDVSKACDSFDGVVVPYVEDVEHAKRLAAAAVYRPLKGKALERVLAGGGWPSDKTRQYVTEVKCPDTVFVPMIESVLAVQNLDAICSIPGVAAVFVGPNDLTVNMGIPNEYDHPDLIATLKRIIDTAETHHVAAGCWFGKRDQMTRTLRQERGSTSFRTTPYCSKRPFKTRSRPCERSDRGRRRSRAAVRLRACAPHNGRLRACLRRQIGSSCLIDCGLPAWNYNRPSIQSGSHRNPDGISQ